MYDLLRLSLTKLIIADKRYVIKVQLCLFDDGHFESPIPCKLIAKKHGVIAKIHTFQMNTSYFICDGIHFIHNLQESPPKCVVQ